jgi:DNA-directed RNA polymerase specialized sigma24 family protein
MGIEEAIARTMTMNKPQSKAFAPLLSCSRADPRAPAGPMDDRLHRELLADREIHESIRTVIRLRGVPRQDVEDVLNTVIADAMEDEQLPVHDREQARLYLGACARARSIDHARSRTRRSAREVEADERLPDRSSPEQGALLASLLEHGQTRYARAFTWWFRFTVLGESQIEIALSDDVHPDHVQHAIATVRAGLRGFGSAGVMALMLMTGWVLRLHGPAAHPDEISGAATSPPSTTLAPTESPLPFDDARTLRLRAEQEVAAGQWTTAAQDLDEARLRDPNGETPEVLLLRQKIQQHLSMPVRLKP